MDRLSTELIEKLKKAQSLEEVTELLKAEGRDDLSAEKLWKDFSSLHTQEKEMPEVSQDELEAVSGGKARNWLKEGCSATMEPGSSCWGTDYCPIVGVNYSYWPSEKHSCPKCGGYVCDYNYSEFDGSYNLGCPKCGRFLVLPHLNQIYKED